MSKSTGTTTVEAFFFAEYYVKHGYTSSKLCYQRIDLAFLASNKVWCQTSANGCPEFAAKEGGFAPH